MASGIRPQTPAPIGDLERERDLEFQQREWTWQRAGWAVMGLIVLAALIGLLGSGPLSRTSTAQGPLRLEYARFERRHAPTGLELTLTGAPAEAGQVDLWFSLDFLEGIEITSIVPDPESAEVANEGMVYRFAVDGSAREFIMRLAFEHNDPGVRTGAIGVVDGPEIRFSQFVYP